MAGIKGKTGIYPKEKRRGLFTKGHSGYWLGKKRLGTKRTPAFVQSRMGEKNPNWRGGKSFEPYTVEWTELLKESIRTRDELICKVCGVHQDELNTKLDIHHIDYEKDNCNPTNLVALCRRCHLKTNGDREYWKDYFNVVRNPYKIAQ